MAELLTSDERKVIRLLADVYHLFGHVVGDDDRSRTNDMGEIVFHIHALQRIAGSQAAARAYPGEFRLLGEVISD